MGIDGYCYTGGNHSDNEGRRHEMTTQKITEYCIIEAVDSVTLTEIVNDHISDGWQPFGHPFLMKHDYEQAMVKYEKPKPTTDKERKYYDLPERPKPNPPDTFRKGF